MEEIDLSGWYILVINLHPPPPTKYVLIPHHFPIKQVGHNQLVIKVMCVSNMIFHSHFNAINVFL